MRRADDILSADVQTQQPERHTSYLFYPFLVNLPGPWAFLTSGYALTLLGLALLTNRIQHIVVPPRHSLLRRLSRQYVHPRSRQSAFRIILSLILPLNIASTRCRALIRSPSLFLLWRSFLRFFVIVLQTGGFFPSASWLHPVAEWGSRPEMKDVCWGTFVAICVTLSIETLMRGLEGRGPASRSPFNLFGYAFLLHIYSSPITHQIKPGDQGPTRPDVHVLVTIIIPLFQLTMTHTLGVRFRWITQRLIPTGICGVLTLIHFHYVLFFSPTPYPLINYLPALLETVLLIIIILSVSLHLLTQLLLEGRITTLFLGHPRTFSLYRGEDFAVALLKIGTACLDATSAAGLGNEVVGISAGSTSGTEAEVELSRVEFIGIRGGTGGLGNEIKRVKAVTASEGDSWIDLVWIREWMRFLRGLWALLKGSWRILLRAFWKWLGRGMNSEPPVQHIREEDTQRPRFEPISSDPEEEVYWRFLRGEAVSDDDEDFIDEDHRARSRSNTVTPSDTDTEEGWETREAVGLYADISASQVGRAHSPPLAPVLLAHVANAGAGPLTRRRYNRLSAHPEDLWAEFITERRSEKVGSKTNEVEETRRNCVVCTIEAREVICWPCRCLALCDDCRANLASRFPASKHICPCCRRGVEGYSRIYIP